MLKKWLYILIKIILNPYYFLLTWGVVGNVQAGMISRSPSFKLNLVESLTESSAKINLVESTIRFLFILIAP